MATVYSNNKIKNNAFHQTMKLRIIFDPNLIDEIWPINLTEY